MIPRRALRAFLRFAFRLFYNPFAFTYDFVSAFVSRGHWRDWTRAAIPHIVGTRVLELPCGTGDLMLDLFAAGYEPIGVDLSRSMLSISRKKVRAKHLRHPDSESNQAHETPTKISIDQPLANASPLVRARVEALPFPSSAFDSITMTFPPSFVFDPQALAELRRVLDDRGRLIWVDAGRLLPHGVWSRALNRALDAVGGEGNFDHTAVEVLSRAGYDCRVETVRDKASIVKVAIATKRRSA